MAFIPQEGNGSLFKNEQGDNPARPKYKGDIMLGGVLYEIAGWIKPMKMNPSENYMSLSAKPKDQAAKPVAKPAPKAEAFDDLDDSMPF